MQIQGQYRYEVQYEVKTRSERGQIHVHKTGEPTAHIHQIPAIHNHIIYTTSHPASHSRPAKPASQPSPASQPARRPASQPATSQAPQPATQPAASQPSQPRPARAASHQPASQKEVRHANTIWEWSTRSGLQKPYGTGERGRNTPPIA